ncbi:MAG TPA: hypothetical protein VK879_14715 [Candidatus Sulfomarinibacteraceae bacterium]|nr:hypothetical protein [Candidatus Sulfomarinibacteraceae bacterium]
MSEQMAKQPKDERMLEKSLKTVLTHRPVPAFVDRLEQRLLAQKDAADAGFEEIVRGSLL